MYFLIIFIFSQYYLLIEAVESFSELLITAIVDYPPDHNEIPGTVTGKFYKLSLKSQKDKQTYINNCKVDLL